MGKVAYDQRGYVGTKMSVNACRAYDDGEMPKSRWTKKAMLDAIQSYCEDNWRVMKIDVSKFKKDDIFARFFEWKSYHHTGKFANATDFYGLNESEVDDYSEILSDDEIDSMIESLKAEEEAGRESRAIAEENYRKSHRGLSKNELTDVCKLMEAYPELFGEEKPSKSGKATIRLTRITKYAAKDDKHVAVNVITDRDGSRFSCFVFDSDVERAIEEHAI